MSNDTYLSVKQLAVRFNTHRGTIWRWVQAGRFPAPVRLTPGCTRWKSSDVEAWEAEREGVA